MRSRFLVPIVLFVCVMLTAVATARSGDVPVFFDLKELNLKVKETAVQKKVRDALGNTIESREGFNLAVVTLAGRSEKDGQTTLGVAAFEAVYEEEGQAKVYPSSGVSCTEGFWGVAGQGNIEVYLYCEKGESVEIKAAFSVPEGVKSFRVRYPTVAGGTADLK